MVAPVQALPQLKKIAALRGVAKLYPMHRDLAFVLAKMRDRGVFCDVPYVTEMRSEFDHDKAVLATEFPFNPDSPKQVLEYFHDKGIHLENAQEETVRDAVGDFDAENSNETHLVALANLLEYKELGDGVDRWFAPLVWVTHTKDGKPTTPHFEGFVDENGYIHPSLGFFTSSARLMCVDPNLQNVAKRRVSRRVCICGALKGDHPTATCAKFKGEAEGKKVRRAIIAPPGFWLIRADYSNAENRNYLYQAGYPPPKGDLHTWMVGNIGLTEDDEFSIRMGGAREASKTVVHATDYLEGLQLKNRYELKARKCQDEIAAGARLVFPDWTFRGRVVTFTGVNLANRCYGEASYETRHRCLELVERYLGDGKAMPSDFGPWPVGAFPKMRDLQRKILKQCETEKIVRPPHGYALISFGRDEDRCKQAAAVFGSQPVAHFTKLALLRLDKQMATVPLD
ncbi:MAG: DNA polymerase, partial [Methanomicrobiales archaeon]|nr:DNA polymerase [Methanomicrobiales archaeon]